MFLSKKSVSDSKLTTEKADPPQRKTPATAASEFTDSSAPVNDRLDRRLVMVGIAVTLGTVPPSVTMTIVNVATHTLGEEFNASISTIQWALTAYLLALAGVIPVTGWASERFGAKRVWVGALLIFMAGSALCAVAWSVGSLIAFRVLQGIGGGMITPVGQTIIAQVAGPHRIGRTMSLTSLPIWVGSVAGPMVGGLIISDLGWRWIFLINLPLAVVAILAARRILPDTRPRPGQKLDLRGLLLLSSGVTIFVYGMSELGGRGGTGRNASALAVLGTAVILVVLYLVHARARGRLALIDISLFRERGFAAVIATNLVVAIALYGVLVVLPLYWQIVRGTSPFTAGLLITPQALGVAITLPLAGRLTDRFGAGVVVPVGMSLVLLGIGLCTQITAHTSYAYFVGAVLVFGIGQGATAMPLTAAAYARMSRDAIPRATSALYIIKWLGASLGTAALAITLDRAIDAGIPNFSEVALDPLPPATRLDIAPVLADAFATTFWVAFALTAISFIPAMMLPRTGPRAQNREQVAGRRR
jgi:EmrB/QacA subfamily drug resistance transporter